MTHKEDLIRIFKEAGVEFHLKEEATYHVYYDITLAEGDKGVKGCSGFYTGLNFNEDGSLKEVIIGE